MEEVSLDTAVRKARHVPDLVSLETKELSLDNSGLKPKLQCANRVGETQWAGTKNEWTYAHLSTTAHVLKSNV